MDKLTINAYLSALMQFHGLRNDAALCRAIKATPPSICKLRKGRIPLTSGMFCKLHEHLGVQMADLRAVLDPREFSAELQEPDEVY